MGYNTCRFCKTGDRIPLIKYGVRHHAHAHCYLERRVGPGGTPEKVAAALDQLSITALGGIPVMLTFDHGQRKGVMSELGMSIREFETYFNRRLKASGYTARASAAPLLKKIATVKPEES